MSSTDRGQCACVPAQRANVAGLASSARCARPQMLCILLVNTLNTDLMTDKSPWLIGRAQRACNSELNADYVCMYVCMFICHQPTGLCTCVPAQRANVAGLASSARCARPQMLCILLVVVYKILLGDRSEPVLVNSMPIMFVCMMSSTDRSVRMRPRATRKRSRPCLFRSLPKCFAYNE